MKKTKLALLTSLAVLGCEKTTKVTLDALPPVITPAPLSMCPTGGYLVGGFPVCNGQDGTSVGVNTFSSSSCASGGTLIEFFKDLNNNGLKDSFEPLISVADVCNGNDATLILGTASTAQCANGGITVNGVPVCNGLNGLDGANGQDATLVFGSPTIAQCPNGGITINGHPVCNGLDGVSSSLNIVSYTGPLCANGGILVNGVPVCNGETGPQGPQGPQGPAGAPGSNVIAAKLCPADTNTFAEYGFIIGGELYAVLYSNQHAHPHQIGLVRLSPGTYITTTTGTSKTFTYSKSGTNTITLTCDSVTANYTF